MQNRIISTLLLIVTLIALYLTYERFREQMFEQKLKEAELKEMLENRLEGKEGRQYY